MSSNSLSNALLNINVCIFVPIFGSWPILTWNLSDERVNILSTVPIVFRLGSKTSSVQSGLQMTKEEFYSAHDFSVFILAKVPLRPLWNSNEKWWQFYRLPVAKNHHYRCFSLYLHQKYVKARFLRPL